MIGEVIMILRKQEVFKGIKNVNRVMTKNIVIFPHAEEVRNALESKSYFTGLKDIPLLGDVPIAKRKNYSRYDYVMIQLYLYGLVKESKEFKLKYSLNNKLKNQDFTSSGYELGQAGKEVSIADVLQILSLIYSIGHFRNTFTSSRACLRVINNEERIYKSFISNFEVEYHKDIAEKIVKSNNYHRFHLLNTLLILQEINQEDVNVSLAISILTEYLSESNTQSDKMKYAFKLFRVLREISYVATDLSVAPVPIYIDVQNEKHLKRILKERLSEHNDKRHVNNLFLGLKKLLEDSVYNEEKNALIQYNSMRLMSNRILKSEEKKNEFSKNYLRFVNPSDDNFYGDFNTKYKRTIDFDSDNILKLTFNNDQIEGVRKLVEDLNKTNFVKAAYYLRLTEKKVTMLASIKVNCVKRIPTSFKVLKMILNRIMTFKYSSVGNDYHDRVLLTTKFFLYSLFDCNNVILEGQVDLETCVILNRGSSKRVKSVQILLNNNSELVESSKLHELEFILTNLKQDRKNDLCLVVCSSIKVKDKKNLGVDLKEFDGMIIFPNREKEQIIFMESKDRKSKPGRAKNDLIEKLKVFKINYEEKNIKTMNMDCRFAYTIE